MRKLAIILLTIVVVALAATQLLDNRVLDREIVINPGETKSFDVVLHKGGWICVESYSNSNVYSTRRDLMIYVMDDEEYAGFSGTNSTLKDMIRAAHVTSWLAESIESVNAVYLDRVNRDSIYHVVLDNNSPAFSVSNSKAVELHITVKSPYAVLTYLADIRPRG